MISNPFSSRTLLTGGGSTIPIKINTPSGTTPATGSPGDLWFDTANNEYYECISSSPVTWQAIGAGGSGTVTSVGLAVPSRMSVSGSPITTSGTLTITDNTENANIVFAGPSSGVAAAPTFRSLVSADIPALSYVTSVGLSDASTTPIYTISGSPITSSGTVSLTLKSQTANQIFAAPNGSAGQPGFRALVNGDLPTSGVTAGSYTNSNITVNAQGIVTAASNGSGGGAVSSVTGTTNEITASPTTGAVVLSLPSTLVAPGTIQDTSGMLYSTTNSITAAGSTQGTATALTTSYNVITGGSPGTGVVLPTGVAGLRVVILNTNAGSIKVYPASGSKIDSSSINTAITLASQTSITFEAVSATQWWTVDQPLLAGTAMTLTPTNGGITISPSVFNSSTEGVVPASGGGTANFLRADGTWTAPPSGGSTFYSASLATSATITGTSSFVICKTASIPGNTLAVGSTFRLTSWPDLPVYTSSSNLVVGLYFGPNGNNTDTLVSQVSMAYPASTSAQFMMQLDVVFSSVGSSGAVTTAWFTMRNESGSASLISLSSSGGSGINTTAAGYLTVVAANSATPSSGGTLYNTVLQQLV